jgi:hypothetical protein
VFDLPASQVTPAHLQAPYASHMEELQVARQDLLQ